MTCSPVPLHPSQESAFPGLGRDICRICGTPTVSHAIGQQCPQFPGPRLTLPAVSKRTTYRRRAAEKNRMRPVTTQPHTETVDESNP